MENNPLRNPEEEKKVRDAKLLQSVWAYALLSWLMATLPAIIILPKLYAGGTDETNARQMQIIMIGFCSLYGAGGGLFIGLLMALAAWKKQILPAILAPLFGGIWGIVIGAIGGFPIFFIGGIFLGWMFAVPFGIVGFTLFSVVYELLAARSRLRWWHVILIQTAVLCVILSGAYLVLKY